MKFLIVLVLVAAVYAQEAVEDNSSRDKRGLLLGSLAAPSIIATRTIAAPTIVAAPSLAAPTVLTTNGLVASRGLVGHTILTSNGLLAAPQTILTAGIPTTLGAGHYIIA
ncbi:uncharacterized protein [Anabrus simplex]|uniref:uncharacterized protein n=1 Tax=Anabrus simplex TaxID=316456 RepID=UPI0035A37FEF